MHKRVVAPSPVAVVEIARLRTFARGLRAANSMPMEPTPLLTSRPAERRLVRELLSRRLIKSATVVSNWDEAFDQLLQDERNRGAMDAMAAMRAIDVS